MKKQEDIMCFMKYITVFCLSLFFVLTNLYSGPIYEEFKKLERQHAQPDIQRAKKNLETNLLISLRRALELYYDYKPEKKLSTADIKYEAAEKEKFTYYVKYKNFIAYFTFIGDPSSKPQYPIQEKVIKRTSTNRPINKTNKN